ncbi:MAG: bifunctional folylpolyglutamate synthase/dihydrofolate synthase [Spirochaetales bacterium]|jgi:dihydrofolate synthase/folylpolyglutamate synthase|nr:bifunctional folylpolyglutamate synthase/dihydrofolate synthase [Spirochaetales bacterium]
MSGLFPSTEEVFSWLEGFSNFERNAFTLRNFRLDRMEALLDLFGKPHRAYRCLHIAGSKGKGSTAAFLASVLSAAGLKTGLYTSPHLVSYKERISLAGEEIADDVFICQAEVLRGKIESLDPARFPGGDYPTTFELLTCLGFLIFRALGCAWAVLETGMGGRLDATNVCLPEACVLTPIEFEHTEYLGDTISAIAREKAGIIKSGVPVFCAPQTGEALAVFRAAAAERGCGFHYLPEYFTNISCCTGMDGSLAELQPAGEARRLSLRLRLSGEVQAENAALAFQVIRAVLPELSQDILVRGLEAAFIPGRLQKVEDLPPVFVDGSHTPLSVKRLLHSFRQMFAAPDTLILGIVGGKRCEEIAAILCPAFRSVIVTTPGTFKASDPRRLYEICLKYNASSRLIPGPADAFAAAKKDLPAPGSPVLITGSFYLAGEILKLYKNEKAANSLQI